MSFLEKVTSSSFPSLNFLESALAISSVESSENSMAVVTDSEYETCVSEGETSLHNRVTHLESALNLAATTTFTLSKRHRACRKKLQKVESLFKLLVRVLTVLTTEFSASLMGHIKRLTKGFKRKATSQGFRCKRIAKPGRRLATASKRFKVDEESYPLLCTFCGLGSTEEPCKFKAYDFHHLMHHKKLDHSTISATDFSSPPMPKRGVVRCRRVNIDGDQCQASFNNHRLLRAHHLDTHHLDDFKVVRLRCVYCFFEFPTDTDMIHHLRTLPCQPSVYKG